MAECCTDGTKLIYSCSGASNVGEIADRVTRKLRAEGLGRMTCPVACAKKNLEHVGIKPKSFILTEMGLVKGKTPVNEEIVDETSKKLLQMTLKK